MVQPCDPTIVEFRSALLKVASRCNLNCDYCYVYHHVDQSWRTQPHFMSEQVIVAFANRLNEYVTQSNLTTFSICFHGGEPLLFTADKLSIAANTIRNLVDSSCSLDFSIQTNGVLLTSASLTTLEEAEISVSLSLDGPKNAHDIHRLDHNGKSTFEETMSALALLKRAKLGMFRGIISVINPYISPRELLEFFSKLDLPQLDLLLPDATYLQPPPGVSTDHDLYVRWIDEALRLWYNEYSYIPLRWFDALLGTRVGLPSPTDAMGLGAVSLVVVETNGTYTDHDVFKITRPGGATLDATVYNTSLTQIACHPTIQDHNYRLQLAGLAKECKTCPVVEGCGGGSVMHRFHANRGLDAPSVYCKEIFSALKTATSLLRATLGSNLSHSEEFPTDQDLPSKCKAWRSLTEANAVQVLQVLNKQSESRSAGSIMLEYSLQGIGQDISESEVSSESILWLNSIRVQSSDPWLVLPFSSTIKLLSTDSVEVKHGLDALNGIAELIHNFSPHILDAISLLISDILFVETIDPEEKGIFSFSDDKAPNILYISTYAGGQPLAIEDLADSILHEFFHQVLHHIEQEGALLYDKRYPRFPAPWRNGLRRSGGFLHGTFVFAGLSRFWSSAASMVGKVELSKAQANASTFRAQAHYGISALREFALLTSRGLSLLSLLEAQLGETAPLAAPPVNEHFIGNF